MADERTGAAYFHMVQETQSRSKKKAAKKIKQVKSKLEEQVKESARSNAKYERLLEKEKELGAAQADFLRGKQEKVALKMIKRSWDQQVASAPCRSVVSAWRANKCSAR